MKFKIAADTSSNVFTLSDVDFASVPLKVDTGLNEYIDTPAVDVAQVVRELEAGIGSVRTSCPNLHDWLSAFEGADAVFAVTITSKLSGSYSAAVVAAREYEKTHPGARVCVLDSLSAGPELRLIVDHLRERILAGDTFEAIEASVRSYMKRTHLLFTLKSMKNLARSGRISPAIAKLASMLGICAVGIASDEGTVQPLRKCRGEKKTILANIDEMVKLGFQGGRVCIDHCLNPELANNFRDALLAKWPSCSIEIHECGALCSFYAENGGCITGFECS